MPNARAVATGWPWRMLLGGLLVLVFLTGLRAQDLPPKPDRYVTDHAGVLDAGTVASLNQQLDQFERETSNQIVVAIYPSLPADADIAQYATDTYQAWGVGQKGRDNGAILFVFVNDHRIFISTGRGLEGALPDATCKNIITQIITPAFRQGDYAAGIRGGVQAMLAATKGEYKGTGTTRADGEQSQSGGYPTWLVLVVIVLFILGRGFFGSGLRSGPLIFTGGGWGGGGGGGNWGGGGGGGFSGGGGNSAGGGAGGSW